MDVIAKLPGCAGQAADAVSADTQVKMEDASTLLEIPKSECSDIWIRPAEHKWPTSLSSMEDPVVPLERNLYGRPVLGNAIRESSIGTRLGKSSKLGMCMCFPRRKTILVCVRGRYQKLDGKKQYIDPMWKVLMKEVDLGEPTSFLDHVYLGCTQRECETSKDVVDNYRNMLESRISAKAKRKATLFRETWRKHFLMVPWIWKVMQRNTWSDIASWRTTQPGNCTKLQLHALMTINSKKKKWELLVNCQKMFSTCPEMPVFGTHR